MHRFPKCVWNDIEIVWGRGTSPQTHESCTKRPCGFGIQPAAQAAWFFSCRVPWDPLPSFYLKWEALSSVFGFRYLSVASAGFPFRHSHIFQPECNVQEYCSLLGCLSETEDIVCPQPMLPPAVWASAVSSPTRTSLLVGTAFRLDPKKLLQVWAKVSVKEPRVWTCLLHWLQQLDIKCGSCSYMLTERFKAGKQWPKTERFQAAGTTGPDVKQIDGWKQHALWAR